MRNINYTRKVFDSTVHAHIKRGLVLTLKSGLADDIDIYRDKSFFYVLTRNNGLGYIGLEVFTRTGEFFGDIFVQFDHDQRDIHPRLMDLAPFNAIKLLAEYVY